MCERYDHNKRTQNGCQWMNQELPPHLDLGIFLLNLPLLFFTTFSCPSRPKSDTHCSMLSPQWPKAKQAFAPYLVLYSNLCIRKTSSVRFSISSGSSEASLHSFASAPAIIEWGLSTQGSFRLSLVVSFVNLIDGRVCLQVKSTAVWLVNLPGTLRN